jgi:hypothetical protein
MGSRAKIVRVLRVAVATAGVLAAAEGVRAEQVGVAGRALRLDPAEQFCALDRGNADEAHLFDAAASVLQSRNRLLAYWAQCGALDSYRAGEQSGLWPYVLIMAPLSDGRIVPMDVPRATFLAEVKRLFDAQGGGLLDQQDRQEIRQRFDQLAREIEQTSGTSASFGEAQMLGLLTSDTSAHYVGMLQPWSVGERRGVMAGITAVTEIRGLALSVNVYDEYAGPDSFDRLQQQARQIVRRLIAGNGS